MRVNLVLNCAQLIKNHLRTFEGHFGRIVKNHDTQVWVMQLLQKRNGAVYKFLGLQRILNPHRVLGPHNILGP